MYFGSPDWTDANPTPLRRLSMSLSLDLGSFECIDGDPLTDECELCECNPGCWPAIPFCW